MLGEIMKLITCYLCARPQVVADACSPGELSTHPRSFRLCPKEIFLACLFARYGNSQRAPHHLPVREQVDPASPGGGLTCHTSRAALHTLTQMREEVQIVRPVVFQDAFQVQIQITQRHIWSHDTYSSTITQMDLFYKWLFKNLCLRADPHVWH